jgi:pectate lyase
MPNFQQITVWLNKKDKKSPSFKKWPMKKQIAVKYMETWKPQIWLALGIVGVCLGLPAFAMDCPIGWAAVNALGQNGTTGGGNGPVVHVSTLTDLAYYAGLSRPYTILVDGSFTNASIVNVTSHKTIIGVGAGATLDGTGLSLNTQSNVIVRNLTIRNVIPTDAFAMRTSHHVWLDHCDLSACGDALADITIGSDYVTVSWTKFHNHDKVSLVNSGTSHFEDVGKCKATYHHNWFADNVQRNPRVGYGKGMFSTIITPTSAPIASATIPGRACWSKATTF